jgi:hypothetical protein
MRRALFTSLAVCGVLLPAILPTAAEEISLKDGTKIVGHMTSLRGDMIEVETAYGKMQLKRADIVSIAFPENASATPPATPAAKDAEINVEESLRGTQYVNKTGHFTLIVPPDWKINLKLPRVAPVIATLSSHDDMGFLLVTQEEFSGSLESYKGLLDLQYGRTLGDYKEVSESPLKIDGKSGLLFSFRGISAKANNLPMQFLVAIIPSGTTYTRVATWCVEPLFHEMQPVFETIVNSYRSTGVTAVAQFAKP